MEELQEPRDSFDNGLAVTLLDMIPKPEMVLIRIGIIALAQLTEDFCHVIHNETKVAREVFGLHFGQLPPRQIGMPTVVEGHVVADRRSEEHTSELQSP